MDSDSEKDLAVSPISGYYFTINQLTPSEVVTDTTESQARQAEVTTLNTTSKYIFIPLIIFILLFVSVYAVIAINKIRYIKRMSAIAILAFFVISIPLLVGSVKNQTRFLPQADITKIPRNIEVTQPTTQGINIRWQTDKPQIGAVRYAVAPLKFNEPILVIEKTQSPRMNHSIAMSKLMPGVIYEFEILSDDIWYDNNGKAIEFYLKK